MLRFKDINGSIFSGASYREVVRKMRNAAWITVPKRQYIREVAKRLKILGTSGIATTNSKAFVQSLVKSGWFKPVAKRA